MLKKCTLDNYLVFTDLDGTLLDHDTYSFEAAKEMLQYLKESNIPLIIVTSKTKDEVVLLQKNLNINSPFIIENGAGIFIPKDNDYEIIALGKNYQDTLYAFSKYSKQFKIKGFHQMSDEEVSVLTQLSLEKASLAKKRHFSEPFILEDKSKLDDLRDLALKDGFDVVKGGRFYHLITFGQDKANALFKMKEYYEDVYKKEYKTIALGDGENDITMLDSVDFPVLIKRFDNTYIKYNKENLYKTKNIGPKGWNEALKGVLCPK